MAEDRPRQPAYEIFNIKRRFRRSNSIFLVQGNLRMKIKIKERYPCKSRYFTSDELFSCINIDDFERL